MNFFILRDGIIIRVSGVQVPPPLPKNFNEIDQIYQSHLICGGIRIRFIKLICQSVCDQCVTEAGITWPRRRYLGLGSKT